MCKIKKNFIIFPQLNLFIILEIIQQAIFPKIVANNDNEIFHVKVSIVLHVITLYIAYALQKLGFLICVYTTRDGIYNYHATLRLLEALLAPNFCRKSRAVVSCFML